VKEFLVIPLPGIISLFVRLDAENLKEVISVELAKDKVFVNVEPVLKKPSMLFFT